MKKRLRAVAESLQSNISLMHTMVIDRAVSFISRSISFVCLCAFISSSVLFAQTGYTGPSGPSQFGAVQTSGIESIDLSTLNIALDFPVFSKSGRGLPLNTHITHIANNLPCGSLSASNMLNSNSNYGWQDILQNMTGYVSYTLGHGGAQNVYYIDAYGASHEFGGVGANWTAADNTGLTLTLNLSGQSIITAADGQTFTVPTIEAGSAVQPGGTRTDSNGNEITVTSSGVTDTLGISIQVANPFNDNYYNFVNTSGGSSVNVANYTTPASTTYSYKDSTGTARTATVAYQVYAVGLPPVGALWGCGTNLTIGQIIFANFPSSITLANGQSYAIQYEESTGSNLTYVYAQNGGSAYASYTGSYITGRISRITLPAGGVISYSYDGEGSDQIDGGTDYIVRTVNGSQWTYSRAVSQTSAGNSVATTVTNPDGYTTIYTFVGSNTTPEAAMPYVITSESVNGNTQTPLRFTEICYNGLSRPCSSATAESIQSAAIGHSLPANTEPPIAVTDSYVSYNGYAEARTTTTYSGQLSVPVEKDEYDFGGTTPLRKTFYQYLTMNGLSTNKLTSVVVQDGQENVYSQTEYGYDETTPTATSGILQHTAISGQRGNLTSVRRWSSTDSKWLITSYTHDDTGNVLSMTDPKETETSTWSYSDVWGADASACSPGGSTLAFPTTYIDALNHMSHMTYDPCWGDLLSQQAPNDVANNRAGTVYTYDSVNNPLSISYPDGGGVSTSYNGYALPLTKTTTTLASPDPSVTTNTVMDVMGRVSATQLSSDPYGTVYTSYTYDPVFDTEPEGASDPYRSTSDPTYRHGSSLAFDALGRTTVSCSPIVGGGDLGCEQWNYNGNVVDIYDEQGNHSQEVMDGLGRVIKVFEPNSSNSPTIETDYSYDPLDDLLRIDQWGGANGSNGDHVRRFAYDSLSRLVAAYNPENTFVQTSPVSGYTQYPAALNCVSGGPWTSCYTYDYDSNLIDETDNRGIQTSIGYDKLNRIVSKSYNNDPSSTLAACYLYDVPASGYTDSNPALNLTAEWTVAGTCQTSPTGPPTSAQTERIITGHDPMGRILGESQCPFSSCSSLYSLTYSFDAAGNPTGTTNGLTGSTAISLSATYDAAGRLGAVASSWNDATHPAILFQANSQTGSSLGIPYSAVGLANAQYGVGSSQVASINQALAYDVALRLTNETDLANVLGPTNAPTTGTVTIGGTEGYIERCQRGTCGEEAETGIITVTVGSYSVTYDYGGASTDDIIASSIAASLDVSGSPVSAVANGAVVTITSSAGVSYALSASVTPGIGSAPFTATASGPELTNSEQASYGTLYSYNVPSGGYAYNNSILSLTDAVTGQWGFSYDYMNRLSGASATSGVYHGLSLSWSYDAFGNRLTQTASGTSSQPVPSSSSATFSSNNQVMSSTVIPTGFYYDAMGNVLNDGVNQYAYDGAGRLCGVRNDLTGSITGYIYDAEGRRVAKGTLSALACGSGSFSLTNEYLLGPSGEQVTELNNSGTWQHSNVFARGKLFATYDGNGLHFHFSDPLGSRRIQVTAAANSTVTTDEQCFSLPYGDGLTCSGSGHDATEHHFTGKERDTESGNDYFGARYYASSMGRFMSPDSSGLAFANPGIPQSLNLYSYALNNPLINIDPTGMECVWDDGSYDAADDPDTGAVDANGQHSNCGNQGGTWVDPDLFENGLLTNGQYANIQYGSSSNQANSVLAASWTTPSGTAYGSQWAAGQEVDEALGYFYGNGAKPTLIYNNNDPFTQSFKNSLGMQGILAGVSANCGATSGSVPVGTWEAFANTMIDGPFLKSADGSMLSGYYTPEAQMGGFNSTYSRSGGVVNITVTNPITLNSLALHATAPLGIPNPTSGPLGTVNQQVNITAPDPCQ